MRDLFQHAILIHSCVDVGLAAETVPYLDNSKLVRFPVDFGLSVVVVAH